MTAILFFTKFVKKYSEICYIIEKIFAETCAMIMTEKCTFNNE